MHIKKKYSTLVSVIIIIAIFINITGWFAVKKTKAADMAAGLVLYKSGTVIGEYVFLQDALDAMTDKKGDYEIVFNLDQTEYTLAGETELPEVSSITLSGVYELHKTGENTSDLYLTKIYVDNNICLNSDLILENVEIINNDETKDCTLMLKGYILKIQGEHAGIYSKGNVTWFNLTGDENSCLVIDGIDFYHNSNITVDTVIIKNGALLACNGSFNYIRELFSYGGETMYSNRIFFNNCSNYDSYSNIEDIKIYKFLDIEVSLYGRLDIGSIRQYMDSDSVHIYFTQGGFREDAYCHLNVGGDVNAALMLHFYINNFSETDYRIFRNTSVLCAPNIPVSKISYTFDCENHPEWQTGKIYKDIEGNIWLEPVTEIDSEPLCYILDKQSRDAQNIYYSLDTESKTAIVGKDGNILNSAGYKGANNGNIIIPSYVEKDGIKYTVTRIGSNSFTGGYPIRWLEVADTVKSIGAEAFSGTGMDEISIGSGLESIEEGALQNNPLSRIYVKPANQNFFSHNNILFDKECQTLIKFPGNYLLGMHNYTVPYPVKTIAQGAFKNTLVKQVTLADSVTTIEKEAFSSCSRLESFTGNQIEEIQGKAFYGCGSLRYFNAGTNLKKIGPEIFCQCNSLEWLFLPDSVQEIADKAFCYIDNLKYFIGARNAEYGIEVFGSCVSLSLVQVSEYMESIPESLFYGCTSLEKLYIPEQYTGCSITAFADTGEGNCTVYGTKEQKKFIIRAQAAFEDKSGHTHTMVTETLAEPGEKLSGAEVKYCTYCHYIETAKWIPATGSQDAIPTISPDIIKTPAPTIIETPEPEETPDVTQVPPELTTGTPPAPTKMPDVTPAGTQTENPEETPAPTKTPVTNGSSGGGGVPSGGGGGGGGGAVASQPDVTKTPVPAETPANIPDTSGTVPQVTPEAETPAQSGNNLQTPSPAPTAAVSQTQSPGTVLDNTDGKLNISSLSLKLNKNNKPRLKWKKNPDVSGYIIYRSAERNKNYTKICTIKNPAKNTYTDKKVSPGRKYYYRICAFKLIGKRKNTGGYSRIQNIKTLYLIAPQITASKGKTASKVKYVQVNLKKYSGTDIAIYLLGSNKKYKRLKLTESSIKKYNASFKLRYNSKKKTCCLKAKTFLRRDGRQYYSGFSNMVKVRM